MEQVGSFRFDDPAGEVGVETILVRVGDTLLQAPLTYRGAPLDGADEHLITTMEHTVLGRRWIYDGCGDPVWAAVTVTAALTGGREADLEVEQDGERKVFRSRTSAQGSGAAGAAVVATGTPSPREVGATTVVTAGPYEIVVARIAGADLGDGESITVAPREGDPFVAVRRPRSPRRRVTDPADWFLTKAGRGNAQTRIDAQHPGEQAWSEGNRVVPLIHGATYFRDLYEHLEATRPGDLVFFTDWQGDADQRLTGEPGSEVVEVLGRADERGVDVRGLVWRSHRAVTASENRRLSLALQKRGAEVLVDMRIRMGGSHHQKLVVIRYQGEPERDVAYVGGIDLCYSRRDTRDHDGDPQAVGHMAKEYGDVPPWHDVMARISGPAVHDVETRLPRALGGPDPADPQPGALRQGPAARHGHEPRPAARAGAAASAGRGRDPRGPAAAHLPEPAPRS